MMDNGILFVRGYWFCFLWLYYYKFFMLGDWKFIVFVLYVLVVYWFDLCGIEWRLVISDVVWNFYIIRFYVEDECVVIVVILV